VGRGRVRLRQRVLLAEAQRRAGGRRCVLVRLVEPGRDQLRAGRSVLLLGRDHRHHHRRPVRRPVARLEHRHLRHHPRGGLRRLVLLHVDGGLSQPPSVTPKTSVMGVFAFDGFLYICIPYAVIPSDRAFTRGVEECISHLSTSFSPSRGAERREIFSRRLLSSFEVGNESCPISTSISHPEEQSDDRFHREDFSLRSKWGISLSISTPSPTSYQTSMGPS